MEELVRTAESMPWYGIVIIVAIVAIVVIYLVSKRVSLKVGNVTLEQHKEELKKSEDNSVRLKIHAQIREYENYTGLIERLICEGFEKTFPELNKDERIIVHLFCNLIRRALEKQLMLDLVANHIVNKTDEELREYTSDKTQAYKNRMLNFMSNYNDTVLPDKNILEVINNVNMDELENIYYTIYKKAVKIARQE